jgi:hypothetical protein
MKTVNPLTTADVLKLTLPNYSLNKTEIYIQECSERKASIFLFDFDQGDDAYITFAIDEIIKHWPLDYVIQDNKWEIVQKIMNTIIATDDRAIFLGLFSDTVRYIEPYMTHAISGQPRLLGIKISDWQKHAIICNPHKT